MVSDPDPFKTSRIRNTGWRKNFFSPLATKFYIRKDDIASERKRDVGSNLDPDPQRYFWFALTYSFLYVGGDKQPRLVAESYGSAEAQNGRHRAGSRVSSFLFNDKIRISFRIKKCHRPLKEIGKYVQNSTEHCGRSSRFWFFNLNIFYFP